VGDKLLYRCSIPIGPEFYIAKIELIFFLEARGNTLGRPWKAASLSLEVAVSENDFDDRAWGVCCVIDYSCHTHLDDDHKIGFIVQESSFVRLDKLAGPSGPLSTASSRQVSNTLLRRIVLNDVI
jgi:hypothetical protein